MIRFLDAAGLAQPIYAVEVQGHFYATAELEHIISATLAWQEAIEACDGVYAAEQALLQSLGNRSLGQFVSALQNTTSPLAKERRCAVAECDRRVYSAHIYCTMHRLRMQRTGDPTLARKRGPKKR